MKSLNALYISAAAGLFSILHRAAPALLQVKAPRGHRDSQWTQQRADFRALSYEDQRAACEPRSLRDHLEDAHAQRVLAAL